MGNVASRGLLTTALLLGALLRFEVVDAAGDQACLLEGTLAADGLNEKMRDCVENNGGTDSMLHGFCDQMTKTWVGMAKATERTTWLPACPSGAKASCTGALGFPLVTKYYLEDEAALARIQKSCTFNKGIWRVGN